MLHVVRPKGLFICKLKDFRSDPNSHTESFQLILRFFKKYWMTDSRLE